MLRKEKKWAYFEGNDNKMTMWRSYVTEIFQEKSWKWGSLSQANIAAYQSCSAAHGFSLSISTDAIFQTAVSPVCLHPRIMCE